MAIDFDFDPFSHLDMNGDLKVDVEDLKLHQLAEGHGYSIDDLNNDGIFDRFQNSLNGDFTPDQFEVDLDKNSVIDNFETMNFGTQFKVDVDKDGDVDEFDEALARYIYNK